MTLKALHSLVFVYCQTLLLPFSPLSLSFRHTGVFSVLGTPWVCTSLRAFALAVPSASPQILAMSISLLFSQGSVQMSPPQEAFHDHGLQSCLFHVSV